MELLTIVFNALLNDVTMSSLRHRNELLVAVVTDIWQGAWQTLFAMLRPFFNDNIDFFEKPLGFQKTKYHFM